MRNPRQRLKTLTVVDELQRKAGKQPSGFVLTLMLLKKMIPLFICIEKILSLSHPNFAV
jgi:hypothetical protein